MRKFGVGLLVALVLLFAVSSFARAQGGTIGGGGGSTTFPLKATDGTAAAPSYSFSSATGLGAYFISTDTLGFAAAGVQMLRLSSAGSVSTWRAGNSTNLVIQPGSGNSKTVTVRSTTGAGVARPTLVVGPDTIVETIGQFRSMNGAISVPSYSFSNGQTTGMYLADNATSDTLAFTVNGALQLELASSGVLRLPILPAEGSTKNAMCWDNATFVVTQNAAATCTVSSARFKQNIRVFPVADARRIVVKLHASSYSERQGGRLAIGIIAEQADSADWRLASRDAKGLVTSTNYEEITALLVTVVKDQQRVLDSLRAVPERRSDFSNPWLLLAVGGAAVATGVAARRAPVAAAV